MKIKIRRH